MTEMIASTDPNNNTTSYGYDAVGNLISVTDANNNTTTYAYDSTNELTTITDALGHTTVYRLRRGRQPDQPSPTAWATPRRRSTTPSTAPRRSSARSAESRRSHMTPPAGRPV